MSVTIVAEIGINHNGSLQQALMMMEAAKMAGANYVKFQKREPTEAVPRDQWNIERDTPWGRMKYIDYKKKMEFSIAQYQRIDMWSKEIGIPWFVSVWDLTSLELMEEYFPWMNYYKIPSAKITDLGLLHEISRLGVFTVMSVGGSTQGQIDKAVLDFEWDYHKLTVCHCVANYPAKNEELNLRYITALKEMYPFLHVGYSGHEVGLATSVAAVAMGAEYIERHITLDRTMWGTDQAASVEPTGFARLVKDIRAVEQAMAGPGVKVVSGEEMKVMKKLRG